MSKGGFSALFLSHHIVVCCWFSASLGMALAHTFYSLRRCRSQRILGRQQQQQGCEQTLLPSKASFSDMCISVCTESVQTKLERGRHGWSFGHFCASGSTIKGRLLFLILGYIRNPLQQGLWIYDIYHWPLTFVYSPLKQPISYVAPWFLLSSQPRMALPGAKERLQLFSAQLLQEGASKWMESDFKSFKITLQSAKGKFPRCFIHVMQ